MAERLGISFANKCPKYIFSFYTSLFSVSCDELLSRYVKSRSDQQLKYPDSVNETSDCKPEDIANGVSIVPCGLIAWSLFNDTYNFTLNNENLKINKNGISWKSDRDNKFGKDVYPKNFQSGALIGGKNLSSSIPVRLYL